MFDIDKLCDALDITIYQFAARLEMRPEKFYAMKKRGTDPALSLVREIKKVYPEVSSDFLIGISDVVFLPGFRK